VANQLAKIGNLFAGSRLLNPGLCRRRAGERTAA
jgi:hypothetical protein